MADSKNAPIFTEISPEQNVVEIESLCMQCHEKVQKGVMALIMVGNIAISVDASPPLPGHSRGRV